MLQITINSLVFIARLEIELAPKTCRVFQTLLPFTNKIIQARWSGEAAWIPLGDLNLNLQGENLKTHPLAGEILLYPGGISEVEILFPYGSTNFASKFGQLAGNHFASIIQGQDQLDELGQLVLWQGAQDIRIDII
jgi:hypothetical protein